MRVKILCQLERQKICIFVLFCSLVIMRVNIFSEVYWSFLFPFHWRSCSCHSCDIRLCCCVLDEGTLGLRSSYASLWLLPREKGTFQHLHHVGCSCLLLFLLQFKKLGCWYFYYWFVRAFKLLTRLSKFWLSFPQLLVYHLISRLKNIQSFKFFDVKHIAFVCVRTCIVFKCEKLEINLYGFNSWKFFPLL